MPWIPTSTYDDRANGVAEARRILGTTRIAELLWDEFASNGSLVTYASSGGSAAQDILTNRDGIAQLRTGALAGQFGRIYWSGATIASFLTSPWMIRSRAALSSAVIAGTARNILGMCNNGANPDPLGAAIGAYGAGNTGGSNAKFSVCTGTIGGGSFQAGAQFAANLDTAAHDYAIWYPGSGSLIYAQLDNEVITIATTGITAAQFGQAAAIAHSGDQAVAAKGIDVQYFQVLTTRP